MFLTNEDLAAKMDELKLLTDAQFKTIDQRFVPLEHIAHSLDELIALIKKGLRLGTGAVCAGALATVGKLVVDHFFS